MSEAFELVDEVGDVTSRGRSSRGVYGTELRGENRRWVCQTCLEGEGL